MSFLIRVVGVVTVAAALASAPIQPADATSKFDGIYKGTKKVLFKGHNPKMAANACTGNSEGTPWKSPVRNGTLTLKWYSQDLAVHVANDGTLSGHIQLGAQDVNATGKITGKRLVMEWGNGNACQYGVEATKIR